MKLTQFFYMKPEAPQEEAENLLPKSCYFNDGKSKVDYVLVYKKPANTQEDDCPEMIEKFISEIKSKGLIVEKDAGKYLTTLNFLKIHAPLKILARHAQSYNIGLTCQNPYYKFYETHILDCLTTEVTQPHPESDTYKRAEKTLSGKRPSSITSAERSKIVWEIVKDTTFPVNGHEMTFKMMFSRDIFLAGYPIHDGDCGWTNDGPLTDRQLLYKYWANMKHMFCEQPVHLIEKYYGPKIAFYFALVSLYTKMLIVPAFIGTITVIVGIIILYLEGHHIDEDVCKSEVVLCSDQELQTACGLMKLAYVIDNPVTIIYVILCSFWGITFWCLWQRRQAMLRLRWNLSGVKVDRTMRFTDKIFGKKLMMKLDPNFRKLPTFGDLPLQEKQNITFLRLKNSRLRSFPILWS